MEKEARELAMQGGQSEGRAAWRDEMDSDQEEQEEEERGEEYRSGKDTRREEEKEKGRGNGDRESRQRHIRSYQISRSKSPERVGASQSD